MINGLISVIVGVYNAEKYLDKCVQSILNQSYSNLEILLIDDGSTDTSGKLCDAYASQDERIKVIHKENEGVSVVRNVGLSVCNGEYVSFIDSDDILHLDLYKTALNLMQEAGVDVIKYQRCTKLEDLKEIIKPSCEVFDSVEITKKILRDEIGSQLWQYLFKTHLWEDIVSPKGRLAQDMMTLYLATSKTDKFALTNEVLYYYYEDNASNVSNSNKKGVRGTVDRSLAFWLRTDFCKENKDYESELEYCLFKATSYTISCFCRKEFVKSARYKADYIEFKKRIKQNKKRILKSKQISFSMKVSVVIICMFPKLLSKLYKKG